MMEFCSDPSTGLPALGFVSVSAGHTCEHDALFAFGFSATRLPVVDEPKVGQLTLEFSGLCRIELELGALQDRLGVKAIKKSRWS